MIAGSNLAQIIYTSGTESRPKGAMLTHDALISEYVTCLVDAEITASDVVLHALPLYHCAQLDVLPLATSFCMHCRSTTARSSTCFSDRASTSARPA